MVLVMTFQVLPLVKDRGASLPQVVLFPALTKGMPQHTQKKEHKENF